MRRATLQKFTGGEVTCIIDGVYHCDFPTPEDAQTWLQARHAERVHDGKLYIRNGKNDSVSGSWDIDDDDPIETYESPVTYRVLVGELGMVAQECSDYDVAKKSFDHYVEESEQNMHARGYQERVELWSSENDSDPVDWYEPELPEETDDDAMHECKFCHCIDTVEGGHACQEFTDAGNAPEGTPEHDLWEAVMSGIDSGFLNLDGTEE